MTVYVLAGEPKDEEQPSLLASLENQVEILKNQLTLLEIRTDTLTKRVSTLEKMIEADPSVDIQPMEVPQYENQGQVAQKQTLQLTGGKGDFDVLVTMIQTDKLIIMADDGTFLGRVSTDEYATDSISNSVGRHGSEVRRESVFNEVGRYGSSVSSESANNDIASNPPKLLYKGEFVAYLSANELKTPRVSLEKLMAAVEEAK
jgi:hypothetical protein